MPGPRRCRARPEPARSGGVLSSLPGSTWGRERGRSDDPGAQPGSDLLGEVTSATLEQVAAPGLLADPLSPPAGVPVAEEDHRLHWIVSGELGLSGVPDDAGHPARVVVDRHRDAAGAGVVLGR